MRITRLLVAVAAVVTCASSARVAVAGESRFFSARHYIDTQYGGSGKRGWVRAGNMDRDGRVDLAYSNGWFEGPEDPGGTWKWHPVADVYGISNVRLHDMDHDGDLDLVMSAGHHGHGVYWYANPGGTAGGTWLSHTVDATIRNPEGLAVDINRDGREDFISEGCGYAVITYYENTTPRPQ